MIVVANPSLGSIPAYPAGEHSQRLCRSRSYHVSSKLSRVSDYNVLGPSSTTRENKRRCECYDLHNELVPYGDAWSWQKSIVKERKALIELNQDYSDTLIFLQHHPVYTLGTRSSEEFLNFDVKNAPFDVCRTERGGEVTYHGPGQLVMYPIINLRYHKMDLHWYLRALEEVVIRVLSSAFSINASRIEGLTGVWVGKFQNPCLHINSSMPSIAFIYKLRKKKKINIKIRKKERKESGARTSCLNLLGCLWIAASSRERHRDMDSKSTSLV